MVAIGSPFGLPETATSGIVSAVGRDVPAPNGFTITGAIQTDAPINPGNSGGPLLNADGRVLGLADQIESTSGSNSGVGFAIPAATVARVANTIIAGRPVRHAYLGLGLDTAVSGGAQVASVTAARAAIQQGDLIVAFDGKPVTSAEQLIATVDAERPRAKVTLTVRGGKPAADPRGHARHTAAVWADGLGRCDVHRNTVLTFATSSLCKKVRRTRS